MLVDVVELRYRGQKLAREVVRAAVPIRAELSLSAGRPGWHRSQRNAPLLAGLVVPGKSEWALEPLDAARVVAIRGCNLLIVGLQELRQSRQVVEYRQAWWCRIVGGAAPGPAVIATVRQAPELAEA